MLHSLETFVEIARTRQGKKIAVAAAQDKTTLQALKRLTAEGIAEPVLSETKKRSRVFVMKLNSTLQITDWLM